MTETERLRDALDHIMRVANAGMQPTRRLDWIALRAKIALRGDEWHEGMRDEPGDSRAELIKKNEKLRERLKMYESEQFAAKRSE